MSFHLIAMSHKGWNCRKECLDFRQIASSTFRSRKGNFRLLILAQNWSKKYNPSIPRNLLLMWIQSGRNSNAIHWIFTQMRHTNCVWWELAFLNQEWQKVEENDRLAIKVLWKLVMHKPTDWSIPIIQQSLQY